MKLKPCPFCGQPPRVRAGIWGADTNNWVRIECANMKCPITVKMNQFTEGEGNDEESLMRRAASKWNNRAEVQP